MIIKLDTFGRPIYEPGDIVGVADYNFLGKVAKFTFEPQTPLFHFALIDTYIESEDDYSIIESVNKGPTMGRLAWYAKKDYKVFRVDKDARVFSWVFRNHALSSSEPLGRSAVEKASKFGRHGYDFTLYVKLAVGVLVYQAERLLHFQKPKRLTPDEVPYARNKALVCTELVFEAWRAVQINLRASGHAPLPCEFVLAEGRNELVLIDSHNGMKGDRQRPKKAYTLARPQVEPTPAAEDKKRIAGPDLVARPKGQKRNCVHIYRQPFGWPIRACDWKMAALDDLEVIAELQPAPGLENKTAAFALQGLEHRRAICKHCQAIAQGKRASVDVGSGGVA